VPERLMTQWGAFSQQLSPVTQATMNENMPHGLSRSISRASDVRRAVATHGETEGCEAERETGCFEQRGLSAWMPNSKRSASHRSKPMGCRRGVLERAG